MSKLSFGEDLANSRDFFKDLPSENHNEFEHFRLDRPIAK
jgi:hypothetical protein